MEFWIIILICSLAAASVLIYLKKTFQEDEACRDCPAKTAACSKKSAQHKCELPPKNR